MPHGPEEFASRLVAPVPVRLQHGTADYMSISLLREEMNNMFEFTKLLRSELDGAHYLADGRQAIAISRIDDLSVQLNSLQAEHEHLINEHWVPLQQFASGVMACLSVLSGMDPEIASPLFCSKCGRGRAPSPVGRSSVEVGQGCVASFPIGLVSSDLRAFGLDSSDYPSPHSDISSVPSLVSLSSSGSEEALLHSSSSSSFSFLRKPFCASHWSDDILTYINTADSIFYRREEALISAGESGERQAVLPEGNSSGSSTAFEDASEEVLAEVAEGARGGGGAEGVPDDSGRPRV